MNRSIVSMLLGTFVLRVSTAVTGGLLINLIDELTHETGMGPAANGVLTGGFYATELSGAILFGILADRYGRKIIMVLGPVFGGVAVFLTGLTTFFPVLFFTRLLEGSSTAASIPSTLAFVAAETSHDERLRGRVVSLFELVSLGGMLAVGPALAGQLWEHMGRDGFFLNCVFYCVSLFFYAYGVAEVPRERRYEIEAQSARTRTRAAVTLRHYLTIATNRRVLLFMPTWLAINAVLGLWALQAPLLLLGNIKDPSQFLMQDIGAGNLGAGEAALAIVFGAGLLFWGTVYARFRPTTMILIGVSAFAVLGVDIFAINHLGGTSQTLLIALAGVALVAIFVMSGATPAALGLLADVSESYADDRSAIMGLYSIYLGLGQVIGAILGAAAASWKGIDGLLVATAGLLLIGGIALINLRAHECDFLEEKANARNGGSTAGTIGVPSSPKPTTPAPSDGPGLAKEER